VLCFEGQRTGHYRRYMGGMAAIVADGGGSI
jgi:hypothetical protein